MILCDHINHMAVNCICWLPKCWVCIAISEAGSEQTKWLPNRQAARLRSWRQCLLFRYRFAETRHNNANRGWWSLPQNVVVVRLLLPHNIGYLTEIREKHKPDPVLICVCFLDGWLWSFLNLRCLLEENARSIKPKVHQLIHIITTQQLVRHRAQTGRFGRQATIGLLRFLNPLTTHLNIFNEHPDRRVICKVSRTKVILRTDGVKIRRSHRTRRRKKIHSHTSDAINKWKCFCVFRWTYIDI